MEKGRGINQVDFSNVDMQPLAISRRIASVKMAKKDREEIACWFFWPFQVQGPGIDLTVILPYY